MRRVTFGRPALCGLIATLALASAACPGQELAPLSPCTVSSVNDRVDQSGLSDVDLLFVIDNSSSMASEQVKLARELPRLVKVLTAGDRCAGQADDHVCPYDDTTMPKRMFTPVTKLHLGVVSSNAGGPEDDPNAASANVLSCAGLGDDGRLQNSVEVAVAGVTASGDTEFPGYKKGEQVLLGRPDCDLSGLPEYQDFVAGEDDATEVADHFACVATLGVGGCPFEQQLESMWKALAPSDGKGELHRFLNGSKGQGDRYNDGFLRPDAILAVVQVSDEEDCSITDAGKPLFLISPGGDEFGKDLNLRCGQHAPNEELIHPTERYVQGLKSLKLEHPDRVLFAAIVGIPQGTEGQSFEEILAREDMQFVEDHERRPAVPRWSCRGESVSPGGLTKVDEAYPPRRFLEVAKGLGDTQAVVYSICEDNYAPALDTLISRIASKLKGNCLPRVLTPNDEGHVECKVFELLADDTEDCSAERGHDTELGVKLRDVREGKQISKRRACLMNQIAVHDKTLSSNGNGWYYDDFDPQLEMDCDEGDRQRISFRFAGGNTSLPAGASATIECVQPVVRIDPRAKGVDAVNSDCKAEPDVCKARSDEDAGYSLICIAKTNTCQISCKVNPSCPPGWVCQPGIDSDEDTKFCQLPTCPHDGTNDTDSES